jgi:Spy/CpxP family protein refolding chaperone
MTRSIAIVRTIGFALVLAACGPLCTSAQAADESGLMDALRRDVTGGKRELVAKDLALTPAEAAKFWPVYERYERAAALIAQRENRALLDYIEADAKISELNAKRLSLEMLRAGTDEQKLRDAQFKKVMSVLPPKKALRYMQLETRLQTLQNYDIAQQLPLAQ